MNAYGYLFLSCDESQDWRNIDAPNATCAFASNTAGFAEAERLAAALLEWVRHCKSSVL